MIYIASDHVGVVLKSFIVNTLSERGFIVSDLGSNSMERVDYTDYAKIICEKILKDETSQGILICGTGIGMSIMANRHKKIRAALCTNEYMAEMTRKHNNANVLCLGARVIGEEFAISIVLKFLTTTFEGGRHIKRIQALDF